MIMRGGKKKEDLLYQSNNISFSSNQPAPAARLERVLVCRECKSLFESRDRQFEESPSQGGHSNGQGQYDDQSDFRNNVPIDEFGDTPSDFDFPEEEFGGGGVGSRGGGGGGGGSVRQRRANTAIPPF